MNFTDQSYYKGDIDIPFSNKDTTVFVRDYITPLEEVISVQVMGRKLYNEFQAGIIVEPTPDQKWSDLRDGVEFDIEFNGKTYPIKWNGLVNTEKKSFLSYYTYSEWLRSNYTQLLGTGVSASESENSTPVDVREKFLVAQNRAGLLIGDYPISKDNHQNIIIPADMDVDLIKVFEPTLLNFLYHNKDVYDSWIFEPYKKDNHFDI